MSSHRSRRPPHVSPTDLQLGISLAIVKSINVPQLRLREEPPMANLALCTDTGGECLLRAEEVGSDFVAKLLVRLMAGDDVSDVMRGRPLLTPRPQCVNCALRVMRDQPPLLTVEQYGDHVRAGRWSYRRQRRRSKVGALPAPIRSFFG